MTADELTQGNKLAAEDWQEALRFVAARLGVDAMALLGKLAAAPRQASPATALDSSTRSLHREEPDLSQEEVRVCILIFNILMERSSRSGRGMCPKSTGEESRDWLRSISSVIRAETSPAGETVWALAPLLGQDH